MHELSICRALLDEVAAVAARHDARAVKSIAVKVGPLSGVEPDLLRTAYPVASAGTIAADAVLNVETTPLRIRCIQCGGETSATLNRLVCGVCGDTNTQLISGDELQLTGMELIT